MSKKSNPTLIGAFIIGAVALIVVSVVLIGGGKIFRDKTVYITYFDGSLQGLRIGANVTFRGVRIGQVRELYVRFDPDTLEFDSPVLLELEEGAVRTIGGITSSQVDVDELFNSLIEKGLRAQMQMESFVTGQLLIDLDYYPDSEATMRDTIGEYIEIPTIQNEFTAVIEDVQKFVAKLKDYPIDKMLEDLAKSFQGMERIINSPELKETLTGINKLVNSPDTQQLTASLQNSITHINTTVTSVQQLVKNIDNNVDPLANDISQTLQEMQSTSQDIQSATQEIKATFKAVHDKIEDETIRREISLAINEIIDATRSFRILVELLERHPESFLQGKPDSE